ncbi:VF530 family DNA-binding protein [Colwellia sp. D2M02]|uniref:VF530 family DNA-binding protein n=1 Tax=Colwellia asteriadis TaxID=517723 RepID=A0ABN1L2E4_9GAMM|nr:VF530 family DNA-binding protein [Colwellia sp. D2M02]MBU2893031.1 VF530 family DNA-binding protein [Colwellia sp. D2M02]
MSDKEIYKNNPLHGTKLETVLNELVDHYGWEILFAYLNLNCFKTNPSIESSIKFLKKTTWAQEKVEAFYMYQYHSLPKASDDQFLLPPRDRIVPHGLEQRPPKELSLEDAERLRIKKAEKARDRAPADPWAHFKK